MTQGEFNKELLECVQRLAKEVRAAADTNPWLQGSLIATQARLQALSERLPLKVG